MSDRAESAHAAPGQLEETAVVVALEADGSAWVETRRQSSCSGCQARAGCGSGALAGLFARRHRLRAANPVRARVGDRVRLGIQGAALLRGAVMVYALPLVTLFLGGLFGEFLDGRWRSGGEPGVLLGALAGLLLGLGLARRHARGAAGLRPVILGLTPQTSPIALQPLRRE